MSYGSVTLNTGSGGDSLAVDAVASKQYQLIKIVTGGEGVVDEVGSSAPLNVILGANSGVDIGDVDVLSLPALPAGGNTIGTVNIGTIGTIATEATLVAQSAKLPATLGQKTKAASMAVTLASDEDNINVDAKSVIPGTGATNLGKAIDSAAGATDTGIALLAKHQGDTTHVTVAEDNYDVLRIAEFGGLHVSPEQHHVIDEMDATTGWSALGNDTLNLALTTIHVLGTGALSFDKVNGAANTVFGGIEKTIANQNFDGLSPHDILQTVVFASSVADVDYVFLRLGTNSSNYNEWRIDGAALTDAIWETLLFEIGDAAHSGATGAGVDWAAVTYCAIGLAFGVETDTLAGILFDEISFHTNQHVNASINAEVTSSVATANINIQKVGNKAVNTQGGNVQNGTQRVTIATDDVNLAAIKTAVEGTLTVDGSAVTQPVSGTVTANAGTGTFTVDGSGVTQPVSGTVTANAGTNLNTSTLAISATQTDGAQKTQVVDASGDVMDIVEEDITLNTVAFKGPVIMAEASVSLPTRITGRVAPLTVDTNGRLYCNVTSEPVILQSNTGVDIGSVNVLSVLPGEGGLNLGARVDNIAGATDVGVNAVAVRDDTLTTLTPVDGDYVSIRTNNRGALWVEHDGATTVDNAGTFAVQSTLQAGTAAFGKLSANSGVDIGDVDVTSQPARVATTDAITAKLATDVLQDGLTALTPKFKKIDAAGSGDNEIIALSAGKKLRVLSYTLVASGAVNAQWESSTAGNFLSGSMNFAANGGVSAAFCPFGLFETVSGESLNLILSAATSVDGHLTYVEV